MTDRARSDRMRIILGGILAAFLSALDTTILATVMPTIVTDLGGLSLYSWVFSVYMIMTAVSMPVWGKLSDMYGKRTLFFASIAIFLLGSILCGAAVDMTQLILFRSLQGIGAGGLASVPFALVSTVFPPSERGKALGILASAWGISSIVGPLIGSVLVMALHWRWAFYINVPVALAAVAVIASAVRPSHGGERFRVDYAGAVLLCLAILSLMLSLLRFGRGGEEGRIDAVVLAAAFALLVLLFIQVERTVEHPILELAFFRRRGFWVGHVLGFLAGVAMYGVIAFTPLFAQSVMGGTAMQAGMVITPMSLSWSTASVTAGRLAHRIGERRLVRIGIVFMGIGLAMAQTVGADVPVWFLVVSVSIIGVGMGCQTPSLMLTVQQSVDHGNVGVATSTQMLARTIGGAVGVSLLGAALNGVMSDRLRGTLVGSIGGAEPQKLLEPAARASLGPEQESVLLSALADGMHAVYIVALSVVIVSFFMSVLLPRKASSHMTA